MFVWTENSNSSKYASKEISLAIHKNKLIIPFIIGCFEKSDSLDLNLSDCNSVECDTVNDVVLHNLAVKLVSLISNFNKVDVFSNSLLKVFADIDCRVSIDFKEKGIARAEQIMYITLRLGSYCLLFESLEDENIIVKDLNFSISADTEKIYHVKLKKEKTKFKKSDKAPKEKQNFSFNINGVTYDMIYIEGSIFKMGSYDFDNEKPAHMVRLYDFYIGQTLVAQELWQAVIGKNPSWHIESKCPVECVSWNDVQDFLKRLNTITGKHFVLPTEAQ